MKVYQFRTSPFAVKVRKCLDLKKTPYETVTVPYLDRRELMAVTGGSAMVPVLVDGTTVVMDSPRITAYLDERYAPSLRPGALAAAATVFEHWADEVFEEVPFKLMAPGVYRRMAEFNGGREDAAAMYRINKERKFGAGCLDAWAAAEPQLNARLAELLQPLVRTLELQPYLLGDAPTVADAATYGQLAVLELIHPGRLRAVAPGMVGWYERLS